jgi:hypothetical protein
MQFIKLIVIGFVALSVIYLCLSLYSKSVRRERLENRYDENPVEGMDRDSYVEKGIVDYNNSLRPKLLLLVYVVPVVVISTILYIVNTN